MPTIAILGASADRRKFGNRCVRAFAALGYSVYPINPREREIEGFPVFASIDDVPGTAIDKVSVYLPAEVSLRVLDEVARKEIGELWLNPGADDPRVVAKAKQLGLNVRIGCSILAFGNMPD